VSTIIETLSGSRLFGSLDQDHLNVIADLCRGRSFKRGETVFTEGDDADELYILSTGSIALEMSIQPVPERPAVPTAVNVLTPGDCFGWSALVAPYTYSLSGRCMANSTVLAIKGEILRDKMAADPALGYQVMTMLATLARRRLEETRLRLLSGLGIALLQGEMETRG
jgi:CRP-like cAMP-binding protein